MADGEFHPDEWDEGQYSKAKSLADGDFDDPAKGVRLRAAVAQYEATRGSDASFTAVPAPRESFEEPQAAIGGSATGGQSVAREAPVDAPVAERAVTADPRSAAVGGMGLPPAAAQAYNSLANLPKNAWEALQTAGSDAVTSFTNSGVRGFGDEALSALGREGDAAAFKRDVTQAKDRSPVSSFVGGMVPDAVYGTAATALGAPVAATGGVLAALQGYGESENKGAHRLLDAGIHGGLGYAFGKGIEAVPAVAKYVGGKLASTGKRALELGDEYLARVMGATADDIQKIVKKPGGRERLADLANTAREQGLNKPTLGVIPPSLRTVNERAAAKAAEHGAKKDAIYASVDDQALVDSLALKSRIRKMKGKYAEGGAVGQPMRDKVDEIADTFGRMKHVEREPLAYHTTPSENFDEVARTGLDPAKGGKNYDLPKNKNTTYFGVDTPDAPIDQSMQRWLTEVGDTAENAAPAAASGARPMSLLRTAAPVQAPPPKFGPKGQVYNSSPGIKIRQETTPVEALEYLDPDEGVWRAVSEYGKPKLPRGEPALSYERPAPNWYEDDQPLLALAEDAGPSSAGTALGQLEPTGIAPRATPLGGANVNAQARVMPLENPALGSGAAPLGRAEASEFGGANVGAQADVFPPGDPRAALGRADAGGSAMQGGGAPPRGVTPEMLNAEVVPRARRGIPMSEMRKELTAQGNAQNFALGSPEARLRQGVYGAMNAEMRRAAGQVMPGADQALRREAWNEHAALTVGEWAQKRAIRESNNRVVSPSDIGAGMVGGMVGLGSGNQTAGVVAGGMLNRAIRGREHGLAEQVAGAIGNRGGAARGSSVEAFGKALEGWKGRPMLAQQAGANVGGPINALGRVFGGAQDPAQEQKRANDEGRGHLTAEAVKRVLADDPAALGPYSDAWGKAIAEGPAAVSALMTKLERDNAYQRTVKRVLQDQTKRQ